MADKKPVKVFSADRKVRKGILAATFEDFLEACKVKFTVDNPTFVLSEDGTEVDGEFWPSISPNQVLLLLNEGEQWEPEAGASGQSMENKAVSSERVLKLVEAIRKRKAQPTSTQTNSTKKKCQLCLAGWQHFDHGRAKYILQRASTAAPNIGPRQMTLRIDLNYTEIITALSEAFFPNGRNHRGRLSAMETALGTAKGCVIPRTHDFNFGDYTQTSPTSKTRIYLLTRDKLQIDISSESESDDELPDIGISVAPQSITAGTATTATITAAQSAAVTVAPSHPLLPAPAMASPIPTPSYLTVPVPRPNVNAPQYSSAGTPTVSFRMPQDGTNRICIICMERTKNSFFIPCGHTCCMVCGTQVICLNQNCPTCRQPITDVKPMYD